MKQQRNTVAVLTLTLLAVVILLHTAPARAIPEQTELRQSGEGVVWAAPENLSRSGATSEPQMVVDSSGRYHVLWRDTIDGFVYTNGEPGSWAQPAAVEVPFGTRQYFPQLQFDQPTPRFTPRLLADGSGNIHAFWIDTSENGQTLYHSSVPATDFTSFANWTPREVLSDSALKLDVALGPNGRIHLLYVRPADTDTAPAGIYYRRLNPGETTFTAPEQLYASRYLRAVDPAAANVRVIAPDALMVYAVWDDTALERVFFASSANGGISWEAPQEVDARAAEDLASAPGPAQIAVGGDGSNVVVTWRAGHEITGSCGQYYSASADGGATWSLRRQFDQLPGCLSEADFVNVGDQALLLGSIDAAGEAEGAVSRSSYLLAWDGARWSAAQQQNILSEFMNPETNQLVRLHCTELFGSDNALVVAGCDRGNGGDIWLLSGTIGSVESWYPQPSVWRDPQLLATVATEPQSLSVVADGSGTLHAFWFEANSGDIYHSRWDGEQWSGGAAVLTSPQGFVEQLDVASHDNQLYAAWRDSQGGLFFSQASSEGFVSSTSWSAPLPAAESQPTAVSPDILVDRNGEIVIAFAVPLNEQRGVYLTRSVDGGRTWFAPVQVFDGRAAQWDMVDSPQLAATGNGQFHLLWMRRALPPDSTPLALAYSRSEDRGETWWPPELLAEGRVLQPSILTTGERTVHRLWLAAFEDVNLLQHSISADGGLSWSAAAQVAALLPQSRPAITSDAAYRVQVLAHENGQLQNWIWDGTQWLAAESLETELPDGGLLGAAASGDDTLAAMYARTAARESEDDPVQTTFYGMARPLELPEALPDPLPPLTPTPPATGTPRPTATPEPTPTIAIPIDAGGTTSSPLAALPGGNTQLGQIGLAVVPAALVILVGAIIGVRAVRRRRR